MISIASRFITLVLFVLLFSQCSDHTTIINVNGDASHGSVSIVMTDVPAGISHVVATLLRRGYPEISLTLMISDSGQSAHGTFQDVPVGQWHLLVRALDDNGITRYRGETDINIFPGETTYADLELLPATGSLRIHVTWGSYGHDRGLVLFLPFNGNTFDVSGFGNHGSSYGAQYTTDASGHPNSAYLFDGSTNYITVANSASINPTDQITITFWIRVDSIMNNYMPIVVKGGPVYGYFANREYGVWSKQNFSTWYPQWKSAGDSSGMHELDSDGSGYEVGKWLFFAFTVDRRNHVMKIYANGTMTHQVGDSYSSFNVNSYPLIIGWSQENLYEHSPLRGAMDNLRIYTRTLTDAEIQTLYNAHQ